MKKGFTLIELLVVIAIIGMLTSIVLVSLGGARAKGRDAKRMSDIRQIGSAMEMAYDDSSADCGNIENYPVRGVLNTWYDINDAANALPRICPTNGQYLNPVPDDPVSGRHYRWMGNNGNCVVGGTTIPTGQWYCIYAVLESETAIFVSSQKGTKKITGTTNPPANCLCGF